MTNSEKAAYDKIYRAAHKKIIKRYKQEWYKQNKIRLSIKHKKYYVDNKQQVKVNRKNYYEQHTCKCKNNGLRWRFRNRLLWNAWLRSLTLDKCSNCGYHKYTGAIDFHHINPKKKKYNIAEMLSSLAFNIPNKEIVFKEIKKCIVLCSNCHRERHGEERKWIQTFN